MEHKEDTFTVKVTNKLTGEMTEHVVKNAWDAKELYLQLSASEGAIKKAKQQLSSYLNTFLGEDENYQFADGKILRRVQRETRTWTIEGLKEVGLDEDMVITVSKIDMKLARAVIDEMIERGDIKPDSRKTLEAAAEVNATKPYVEIR